MAALSSLGSLTNNIAKAGSSLSLASVTTALVTGQTPKGIAGFVFDIPETSNAVLAAQVTDHFTETNFSIQDHVAIDPVKVTLVGKVGELVYHETALEQYVETVLATLTPLGVLTQKQSAEVLQALSEFNRLISAAQNVLKSASSLYGFLSGSPSLNNQQNTYQMFEKYVNGRALLTVETPWETYQNMVIESLTADQDDTTLNESTFTVQFKQIRFVSTTAGVGTLSGRAIAQAMSPTNSGTTTGTGSAAVEGYKAVGAIN